MDNQEDGVDRDELAQRLETIRRVVSEQLAMKEPAVFDDSVREEAPFHLLPGIGVVIGADPDLAVTDDLRAANEAADIFAPTRSPTPSSPGTPRTKASPPIRQR